MHKFSDFASNEETPLDGDKVRIDNLLNKEIVITKFKVRASKYKDRGDECATVQFYEDEETKKHKIFFTGSGVIISTLKKYEKEIPFATVIQKIDKYYTLS